MFLTSAAGIAHELLLRARVHRSSVSTPGRARISHGAS